jgi:hypothetical protein
MNTPEEQYLISLPTENNSYVNFSIFNKNGDLMSSLIPSKELKPSSCEGEYFEGSIFLLSPVSFSKINLNGQLEWTYDINLTFKTESISGIYPQEDNSVLIFCTYLNNKSDLDIGCIKFNAFGKVLPN